MKKAPESNVVRFVGGIHTTRQGRGFSEAELKEAGIFVANARKLSIRVDPKRHTKLSGNVEKLKAWLGDMSAPKTKKRTKKKP
jgi:ribosomal protein L13E